MSPLESYWSTKPIIYIINCSLAFRYVTIANMQILWNIWICAEWEWVGYTSSIDRSTSNIYLFWIGGELPVVVVRPHAPNQDVRTVTVWYEYMYLATIHYIYIIFWMDHFHKTVMRFNGHQHRKSSKVFFVFIFLCMYIYNTMLCIIWPLDQIAQKKK